MRPLYALKMGLVSLLVTGATHIGAMADIIPVGQVNHSTDNNFSYELMDESTYASGYQTLRLVAENPYGGTDVDTYDFHLMNLLVDDLWSLPANQAEYGTRDNMVNTGMSFLLFGDSLAGEDVVDYGWNAPLDTSSGSVEMSNIGGIPDVTYQQFDQDPGFATGDFYINNNLFDANRNGTLGDIGDLQLVFDSGNSLFATVDSGPSEYNIYGVVPRAQMVVPEPSTISLLVLGMLGAYASRRKNN